MPYIEKQDRKQLQQRLPDNAGELAYILSQDVDAYLATHKVNYAKYAEVIGVLETLKLEIFRRFTAPYEDAKHAHNGDAFTFQESHE